MDDVLISKAAAIDALKRAAYWQDAERKIAELPAVDAAPVVHGRWEEKRWTTDYDWGVMNHRAIVCSACDKEIYAGEKTPYCQNCGAKMDGRETDE